MDFTLLEDIQLIRNTVRRFIKYVGVVLDSAGLKANAYQMIREGRR